MHYDITSIYKERILAKTEAAEAISFISDEARSTLEPILKREFRQAEKMRNDGLARAIAELELKGRLKSGLHRKTVKDAAEDDLCIRAEALQNNLLRVLNAGLLGQSESIGETLSAVFQRLFVQQLEAVEKGVRKAVTPPVTIDQFAQELSEASRAELLLAGREYLQKMRPPPAPLELLPEQESLLIRLVEAMRSVPPEEREHFEMTFTHNRKQGEIIHPGVKQGENYAFEGDVVELGHKQLLDVQSMGKNLRFNVRPEGFRYYRDLRRKQGSGLTRSESVTRQGISSSRFRELYPVAIERWSKAESLLWEPDCEASLTTIGHLVRESIQAFATALVERFEPEEVDENPARDINRVTKSLAMKREELGDTTYKAIATSWKATSALVQRLAHGAQQEGAGVDWEDARRVVFLTMMTMSEVDAAIGDP